MRFVTYYSNILVEQLTRNGALKKQWTLESAGADGAHVDFVITQLPCRIGRSKDNDLVIANLGLSRFHASIARDISGLLRLSDENSTNGTFVNRRRIEGYCLLNENDTVHFGSAEYHLRLRVLDDAPLPFDQMHTMVMSDSLVDADQTLANASEFDDLLMGNGLSGAAQPIVKAQTREIIGYELLGRANHPHLPQSPIELFGLAELMDRELDLSYAFRDFGIRTIIPRVGKHTIFINAHPKETFSELFFASLENLRRASPQLNIVVEIHESAVTDTTQLRQFASRLAALGIRFAFDDFGSGQARLLELADVPAHFVKFDISLIRDLHKASERKQQLVRDLVRMVISTGSIPLAEGVESEEEAKVCVDMGFELIQGFLTGEPIPADAL